jgi:hypothetical protein
MAARSSHVVDIRVRIVVKKQDKWHGLALVNGIRADSASYSGRYAEQLPIPDYFVFNWQR